MSTGATVHIIAGEGRFANVQVPEFPSFIADYSNRGDSWFDAHVAGCCGPSARHPHPFGINEIFPNERWHLFSASVSRRCGTRQLAGRQPLNVQPVREMAR